MTRRPRQAREGLLVGGSCGMAVVAALRRRGGLRPGRRGGRAAAGQRPRLSVEDLQRRVDGGLRVPDDSGPSARVGDVLKRQGRAARCPSSSTCTPEETVGEAIDVLREYGVSADADREAGRRHPDVMAAEVIGSVGRAGAARCAVRAAGVAARPVGEAHARAPLPQVGSGEPVRGPDERAGRGRRRDRAGRGEADRRGEPPDLLAFLAKGATKQPAPVRFA